jgi:glyoxalase family protein
VTSTAFAVPAGALDYWWVRLADHETKAADRFGERAIRVTDPDGLVLEIVAVPEPGGEAWPAGPVPGEHAIRGFHGVTISEEGYESTAKVLTERMGFEPAGSDGNRFRYRAGTGGDLAQVVDLLCVPDARRGGMGAGVVHHVAFRTPDDPQQAAWRKKLIQAALNVSPVMDRNYFHSIYYREPGGVLFEIATDGPGFAIDEAPEQLGTRLKLPAQYEADRAEIERVLPKVRLPSGRAVP